MDCYKLDSNESFESLPKYSPNTNPPKIIHPMRSPDTGRGAQGDESDWRGSKRGNATHISKSDANARLHRKGRATSQLCFMGHTLMENRHGLIVDALVTPATGRAEREAAKVMIGKVAQKRPRANVTLGADKGYDAAEFVKHLQQINVQPHVAQSKKGRKSAMPDPIAQSEGCRQSMHCRKRIEQGLGSMMPS